MGLKKTDVIYQIFPASFKDTNNDGWGDLKGITSKLDYLKDLGIDYLWLCPIYSTHFVDAGYDVDDYYNIFKNFGTINDAEEMINEANKRDIGIVMDIVLNHTSDKHVWFKEAKKSRDNKYYNYFIWSDKKLDNGSIFGGSAWEWNEPTNSYYYHLFSKEQPDMNWDNPELRKEVYKIIEFWIKKGVKGFRIDAIEHVGKDIKTDTVRYGPHMEEYLQEMQKEVFDKYPDVVTMGESWSVNPDTLSKYTEGPDKFVDSFFNFASLAVGWHPKYGRCGMGPGGLKEVVKSYEDWCQEKVKNTNVINFWTCHDTSRALSRWTDGSVKAAKFMATLLFALHGVPMIYQGEEIGMENPTFTKKEEFRDVDFFNHYKLYVEGDDPYTESEFIKSLSHNGRDSSRTPMNWSSEKHGGFSDSEPWIKNSKTSRNVADQLNNNGSILSHYKQLIQLRKSNNGENVWTANSALNILNDNEFTILKMGKSKMMLLRFDIKNYEVYMTLKEY